MTAATGIRADTFSGTVMSAGGTTQPTYMPAGTSALRQTAPVTPGAPRHGRTPAQHDPVLDWLTSREARRYANHWVALNPDSGEFLGLADDPPHLRRWQAAGALVVFVDAPSPCDRREVTR